MYDDDDVACKCHFVTEFRQFGFGDFWPMEAVMRNGVVGGLLCLVGLQSQVNCQVNWKNSKVSYRVTSSISDLQSI